MRGIHAEIVASVDRQQRRSRPLRDQQQFAQALFGDLNARELETFVKVLDRVLSRSQEMLPRHK